MMIGLTRPATVPAAKENQVLSKVRVACLLTCKGCYGPPPLCAISSRRSSDLLPASPCPFEDKRGYNRKHPSVFGVCIRAKGV
eukprot:2953217-Amphidinium_carterae.2